ncbi:acyltransferase domain-containing protein [Streptomyces bacillaris]|uniref:acyltransferase domain-containing protein n=1 Tax=Streptomyces bacillaris TaxID=68179 RepID=UPI0011394E7D|nr:acyltransferase domain-containing protein [Streptomyces sp. S6]
MTVRLFAVAAETVDGLLAAICGHVGRIRAGRDLPSLARYCHDAAVGTTGLAHRAAVAAESYDDLAGGLDKLVQGWADRAPAPPLSRRPGLVFVFAGQGAQWDGMGLELLATEPVFRAALRRCDERVRELAGFSVIQQLRAGPAVSRLGEIDVLQPTMVSLQIALVALWRSWRVEPDAVTGHSMGEISAGYAAGALTLEDALLIACRRSSLLRRIAGRGALATTELSPEAAHALAASSGGRICVAGENSPRSTVLAGDTATLTAVVEDLDRRGVYCRMVRGTVASHSHYVDELRDDLAAALRSLSPVPSRVPFYSTVTAAPVPGTELGPAYWMRNLREPVRFAAATGRLAEDGHEIFVEVSTHPVLLSSLRQTLESAGRPGEVLPSGRRRTERRAMLSSLGMLFTYGRDPHWPTSAPQAPVLTPYQAAVLAAVRRPRPSPVAAGSG